MNDDVRLAFESKPSNMEFIANTQQDKGHGHLETRSCTVSYDIGWLRESYPQWENFNSIIEVESCRELDGQMSTEKRYYISSLLTDPEKLQATIREHWGVENQLHYVLDVTFNDDQSRIRKGNAPQNMASIKKTVLNLLRIIKISRSQVSLKAMRKMAGWDSDFLDSVLMR